MTFNPWQKAAPWPQTDPCGTFSFDLCLPITLLLFKLFAHLLCLVYFGLILFFTAALRPLFLYPPLGTRMLILKSSLQHKGLQFLLNTFPVIYSLLFNVPFPFQCTLLLLLLSLLKLTVLFFFSCRHFHPHFLVWTHWSILKTYI